MNSSLSISSFLNILLKHIIVVLMAIVFFISSTLFEDI